MTFEADSKQRTIENLVEEVMMAGGLFLVSRAHWSYPRRPSMKVWSVERFAAKVHGLICEPRRGIRCHWLKIRGGFLLGRLCIEIRNIRHPSAIFSLPMKITEV